MAVISLDGDDWLIATDPENVGRKDRWHQCPTGEARPTKVPWIIQDPFPCYHGVAWYWHDFIAPVNSYPQGRYLLRFWAVDYMANVWLNGVHVGGHEGGETPFVIDVTEAIRPGETNRLAVRVLNSTHDPIDGIVLNETAHRAKVMPTSAGRLSNYGGITDTVELLVAPAVRIEDLFVRADPYTGRVCVEVGVHNATNQTVAGSLEFTIVPASGGSPVAEYRLRQGLCPGGAVLRVEMTVDQPRLWQLNDPHLYCVTARLRVESPDSGDEYSVRCGFRDFRFKDGYFRLNGRRVFLRSAHTCNFFPIGLQLPHDPDLARRDMLTAKAMGFNLVRFICGGALRSQLDICDELGLMVYEEHFGSWDTMKDSPQFAQRFDVSVAELIRRDRNHPSVVIWGLLNEANHGRVFQYAVGSLPLVRSLDDSRMVMLNSGRTDGQLHIGSLSNPGSGVWEPLLGGEGPEQEGKPQRWADGQFFAEAGDNHLYTTVTDVERTTRIVRTMGRDLPKPVFLSEYGIGSAVDLWRTVRHFERLGKADVEDAAYYRDKLESFLADWRRWRLDECFDHPTEFFAQSLARMASHRTLGLNAVRANPHMVGHSLTSLTDTVLSGEGLTTPFREFKPGTVEAIFDGFAPLRLCLFAEPVHVYRGKSVRLEAVLANEDVLRPGKYPIRLQVVGPDCRRAFERVATVTVPESVPGREPPFAVPFFAETVPLDGPSGRYRFLAEFDSGATAAGGRATVFVTDPADMPPVETEVVLCGRDETYSRISSTDKSIMEVVLCGPDETLGAWLHRQGIRTRRLVEQKFTRRQVLLISGKPDPEDGESFRLIAQGIARGCGAVFLTVPDLINEKKEIQWLPLVRKGRLDYQGSDLYLTDDWAKRHPVFAGLPAGGLMDYGFYRELITRHAMIDQDACTEAIAGNIKASLGYASGLTVSVHRLGAGSFILNTLLIRENLGTHPAAERLLRNMLRYVAGDVNGPLADLPANFSTQLKAMGLA